MNQSFDKQIFGQVVEVIRPQGPSVSTIQNNQLSAFMTSSIRSEQNYSNSSFGAQKHAEGKGQKKQPDALTNYTDNGSVRRSGCELKGLRKNRAIENNGLQDKSIRQLKIRKLTKNDNFYCLCCERQDKNQNCIACQGAGSAHASNNIVKFIEYIMQFKLGIKQSYKNTNPNIRAVPNRPPAQQQDQLINQPRIAKNSIKQQPNNDEKRPKKTINLSSKVQPNPSTSAPNSNQPNRINQFCSEFIKSLPSESSQASKIENESGLYNPSNKLKVTQSTYRTNSNLFSSYNNSFVFNQENVSSINVGINGMTESIIDENLNQRPQKYEDEEMVKESTGRESIGLYYGYDNMQNQKKQASNSSCLKEGKKSVYQYRQSIPQKQTMSISGMRQKLSLQNTIHNGFSCDSCQADPIRGTRYHCSSFMCEDDYDLCEECYLKIGHKHNMVEIKGKNLEKICEGLQQCSSKSIRYSTRMSMGGSVYGHDQSQGQCMRPNFSNMIFKSSIH